MGIPLAEEFLLSVVQLELIVVMQAQELRPAVIDVVFSLSQIEVEDVDGDDLDDPFIGFRYGQVLGNGLGGGEEYSLQEVGFLFVLDLNRVAPLDNFMIYKDIIRLDRPD